jgi:hypothetical protein
LDPIHPIVPGPTPISARLPVEPLERITRERDRPARDAARRRRREPPPGYPPEEEPAPPSDEQRDDDDDGRPHVDVRA